ncbi:MAG: ABC transporter permease [Bacteroidota bacterium]|nr:ABC transporter permease [Bacteroidota bacterium]
MKDNLDSLYSIAWRRLKKNKIAMAGLFFILLVMIVSILGYLITPDSTPFANDQLLEIAAKKPGFKIKMLLIPKENRIYKKNLLREMLYGSFSQYKSIPVNDDYKINDNVITYSEYTGEKPVISDLKTIRISQNGYSQIITKRFFLGTDRYGRDVLSQLIIGARVSLSVGFISVFISLIIGITMGALAGFYRGWVDNLILWIINVVWSIPTMLLVIAITFALGKGFWQVFIAVGLTMWVEVARVVRGQVLSIREKDYIEAARALGFSDLRIITRHILPNVYGSVIVISAANFASAILIEAGLSFLGIGVQPPMPSWGTMIKQHYSYLLLDVPSLAIIPGLAIMLLVLSFMLLGNGLRDSFDPKYIN